MALNSVYTGFSKKPPSTTPIGQGKNLLTDKEFLRCLGQTIRDSRKRNAMTQDRLSEIAGVSPKHLSEVEQGRSNVTVLFLRRVSRALGLDAGALLYGCEDASEERRFRKEVADQLQKLGSLELRRMARFLRAMGESEDQEISKISR